MDMADDAERESYLKEKYDGKVQSNLDKIVVNGFKALGLEYFFTAGLIIIIFIMFFIQTT